MPQSQVADTEISLSLRKREKIRQFSKQVYQAQGEGSCKPESFFYYIISHWPGEGQDLDETYNEEYLFRY